RARAGLRAGSMAERRPGRLADRIRRAPPHREAARRARPRRTRRGASDRPGARLMGPTRNRDLTAATAIAAVLGFVLVTMLYRWFPPITVWTGLAVLVAV